MVDVLEDWEGTDPLSDYVGGTDSCSVQQTTVQEGSNAVGHASSDASAEFASITDTNQTISPGETEFGAWLWQKEFWFMEFLFGVQTPSGSGLDAYAVGLSGGSLVITTYVGGAFGSQLASSSVGTAESWIRVMVTEWTSSGDITAEARDTNGNVLATISTTDSTYGAGNIGFVGGAGASNSSFSDYYVKNVSTGPAAPTAPSNLQLTEQ